ncbi:MAG: hypothetical protein ANABAC_0659 [Anaerolineae bacterium]|nr:MAG: hypothetical protein ANABAC_0659 [Anaerolineae bacterium]
MVPDQPRRGGLQSVAGRLISVALQLGNRQTARVWFAPTIQPRGLIKPFYP